MAAIFNHKKKIALAMLLFWGSYLLLPLSAYALTSGPTQPEVQGFQVATVSDMVDLSSGSLKYNIPLLDIDGYPVNLSYQSGSGIDDEASWVGLGWSLNPGATNRQVRGLPDDFSGDTIETDHYVKPKITVGGSVTTKVEYVGIAALSGSVTFGIFNDNYTGLGAELGANAGISISTPGDGSLTAGLGLGILSNTQSGVDADFSPYVNMSVKENTDVKITENAGLAASFGYNTRSGYKGLTLGQSFGVSAQANFLTITKDQNDDYFTVNQEKGSGSANYDVAGSTITYNTEPISPTITIPFVTSYASFSFNVGGALEGIFLSGGGTGYQNVRKVQSIYNTKPAFGFLYAERGSNNKDAVMDFFRENDNPIIPNIPDIALPVHTPDVWSFTSQTGSGEFRLFRGGSGAFFDNQEIDQNKSITIGADFGIGDWVHGGVTYFNQGGKTTTQKWTNNNGYLPKGDFQSPDYTHPNAEHAYFRMIGEKNIEDEDMDSQLAGNSTLQVNTGQMSASSSLRTAGNIYGNANVSITAPIAKTTRRPNRTVISYLTAAEAVYGALDTAIYTYPLIDSTGVTSLTPSPAPDSILHRVNSSPVTSRNVHKANHISELTVTDESGKRMVYGIPVYNISQDEYSFAVDPSTRDANNLVSVPAGITSPSGDPYGVDNYYHHEHKPSYATSYLLSAILSPDYVDKTGDGVTDDDLGTAIKFNYSKLPYYYKWRTPYARATPNRCLLADPDDDKGSIVYGQKEIWYVQSIESKTKIAYFITEQRRDAAGVAGWQNGGIDATNTLRYLKQIRLYSKGDLSKPIKVVNFEYNYSLCRGVPNSLDAGTADTTLGGKLTLTRVWFQYGNASKGKYHPYIFQYNKSITGGTEPAYGYQMNDRWGVYKQPAENTIALDNEQFPYADQYKPTRDLTSSLWQLSQITLPTGGIINISYESGDYAYVQNKLATAMTPIESLIPTASSGDDTTRKLNNANGLRLDISADSLPPAGVDQTKWFENTYLNGSAYLYTKMYVNMATANWPEHNPIPYDAVPTYCQIQQVTVSGGKANVMFVPINAGDVTANPMAICAWQRMKNEYPRYAYPGFDSRVQTQNNAVLAAVSAVISAARNLSELKQGFYQTANKNGYGTTVLLGQSYVKLGVTGGFKEGGTVRVKKIQISDSWQSTNSKATSASYGQAYIYTTTQNGKTISSGVAAEEPTVGNDENAMKEPVPYIQNIKGAINNYFDLEQPFGESFFPAPGICYSKVTVYDLDQDHNPSTQTGYIVNEFYTFKDYPVKVNPLPALPYNYNPSSHYSLTRTDSDDELCITQGYGIIVNDMQGKTKATTVFDHGGAVISETQYYYNSRNNGDSMSLNNQVSVIDPVTLQVSTKTLGQDVDFFTDFREQEGKNNGQAINIGADVFPILPWLPFFVLPHFPIHDNDDYKLFRSACAVKVVQQYGILNKVVKTENGSTITTTDLAYDQMTGEPLVTQTQNEFSQNIYSVNIPAYWVYIGMGAAYQNLGVLFSKFTTNSNGEVNTSYTGYLQGGDEIIDVTAGTHYWVIYNQAASGSGNTFKLIDRNGALQPGYTPAGLVKVVRSGYRNMLTANTTTLVTLTNPITASNHLNLLSTGDMTSLKVINASATTYDQNWAPGNVCLADSVSDPTVNPVRNSTQDFSVSSTTPIGRGAWIFTSDGTSDTTVYSAYWGESDDSTNSGRRKVIGFWPTAADTATYNRGTSYETGDYFGFDDVITFPTSQIYYFAISSNYNATFTVDCVPNYVNDFGGDGLLLYPIFINAGKHIIHCSFKLLDIEPPDFPLSLRTAGVEIYNNTYSELINADSVGTGLNIIYSTKNFVGNNNLYDFFDHDGASFYDRDSSAQSYHFTRPSGAPLFYNFSYICPIMSLAVNPYLQGYLGNWRPYQTKVFQQNRNYSFSSNLNLAGVQVRNAGYIQKFYPYWYSNGSAWLLNPNRTSWITANTVTLYDQYGQQLENEDALGRFSAAKFDFNGELPSAVASNAMNREIYANSLEDSYFIPGSGSLSDTCNVREFIEPSTKFTIKKLAVNTVSHSGNYSALLPADGVTLSTIIDTVHQKTQPYLTLDGLKQYNTQTITGLYPNGFEPYPGKTYVFDAWVKDNSPTDKSVNLTLSINGNNVPLKCRAVVEGWKLVEGDMNLASLGSATSLDISILPNSGQTIYIDDIRMFPFASLMKTYAYDAGTLRLMAELDENGFATFYEYDDEGLLVRVKKETEKGIMTLKESRSTYRKNTQ